MIVRYFKGKGATQPPGYFYGLKIILHVPYYRYNSTLKLNVTFDWLAHVLLILKVQGSELGPDTCYPDQRFS